MRTLHALSFTLAVVFVPSLALAHDPSMHKGKPVTGEVTDASPNSLTLKLDSGSQAVTLDPSTKVERGDKPGTVADLKPGELVAAFGTRLESGELVAREIVIHEGDGHAMGEHAMPMKGMPLHGTGMEGGNQNGGK